MNEQAVIVIPAYKPQKILLELVKSLKEYYDNIIVVNDGSGNEYRAIFTELTRMQCIVLNHENNMGKGRALKTAFNYLQQNSMQEDIPIVTVDADGQHKIEDILKVAEKVRDYVRLRGDSSPLIVLGARQFEGDIPLRSKFGNTVTKYVVKWICGVDVNDTQTGLRGFTYSCLPWLCVVEGEKYDYEMNVLLQAKKNGIEMIELPIKTVYENNNEASHFNPIKDSYKIYKMIIKYGMSSIISVIVDYSIFGIATAAGVNTLLAVYIARFFAAVGNFVINRNFVFESKSNKWIELVKYAILNLCSGFISFLGIEVIGSLIRVSPVVCKALIETVLFFFNYYVQRAYIFKKGNEL